MSQKISFIAILLFGFLSLSTIALSPKLDKNYFYVAPNNQLSQDLFQTRNGIIAHSFEPAGDNSVSKYTLLDITSKDATPILDEIVSACEFDSDPVFSHLHYHAPTASLVYFCPKNTSLLILDQFNYTVQTYFTFDNIKGSWPIARISTDGMNVAIVGIGAFYAKITDDSMFVKVDLQAKKIVTQFVFNNGLASGENVVAFASSKMAAFIATNIANGTVLTTTIYSLSTIGNTYQLTRISSFDTVVTYKIITKLFCLGNYIVSNNGQDLYFVNQQGGFIQKGQLSIKYIAVHSGGEFCHISMTSKYNSNYLYALSTSSSIDRYSVVLTDIFVKSLGNNFGEFQIAQGNQSSEDLMFALDSPRINFTIVDLRILRTIYSAISGHDNFMLTETTYAVVKPLNLVDYFVYIFDLKTDNLINRAQISLSYHYNKDQHIISSLKKTDAPGCWLEHVDLTSGKVWTTLKLTDDSNPICNSYVYDLRITEKGNPEVVFPLDDHYLILTETYGQITFKTHSAATVNYDSLNLDFDTLSLYYMVASPQTTQHFTTLYSFDAQLQKFIIRGATVDNIQVKNKGFFAVNTTMSVALSNTTFALLDKLRAPVTLAQPNDWNFASSFQDSNGNQFVIATYANTISSPVKGSSVPQLFATSGDFVVSLPGLRSNSIRAQAAGPKSYWIYDDVSSAFGLLRAYNAGSSAKKTLFSMFESTAF